MSYTMTHIYIAERVAGKLNCINDYPTYLLGAVAPDAVHARDDYNPSYKETSHLFSEGLRWGRIENETQVDAWKSSIREYYNLHKSGIDYDFLLGYMVHLFSDVYSSTQFYAPLVKSFGGDVERVKPQFWKENFGYNYYLYLQYSKDHDLCGVLNMGRPATIEGVIEAGIIDKRLKLLFKQEFAEKDISDMDSYTICTHEAMRRLIDGSTDFVLKELKILDKDIIKG